MDGTHRASRKGAVKVLIQRVARAAARVDGREVGSIGRGLLVFLGVETQDTTGDAGWFAAKTAELRIFGDDAGRMNRSVSQFTLAASTRRGRRPSFEAAADPARAEALYLDFVAALRTRGIETATGTFRAMMEVELVNDGPVTILLDPREAGER
jgi:D-tyrosyl-tRNA(Tyr) deacylase